MKRLTMKQVLCRNYTALSKKQLVHLNKFSKKVLSSSRYSFKTGIAVYLVLTTEGASKFLGYNGKCFKTCNKETNYSQPLFTFCQLQVFCVTYCGKRFNNFALETMVGEGGKTHSMELKTLQWSRKMV